MATQYTPILQLALPVTGELNGTWGDVVNDNITSMVEEAIAGLATISTWTANAHTLTTADGVTDEARCAMLVLQTGAGGTALSGAGQVICPALTKLYVVKNDAAYAVTVKTSGGSGVAIAAGDTAFVFCDGTNVNACVTQIINGHITGNLTVDGNTTLGDSSADTVVINAGSTTLNDGGAIRFEDNAGGEYVALKAPATIAASFTLTLPIDDGVNGQALITDGSGNLSWSTAASGDVYGPASATDNAVARFDGTTGKLIQNSAVTIGDDGATVIAANSTSDGLRITQIGTGNALLVEDSANPDSTPFVIDTNGIVVSGSTTSASGISGSQFQVIGDGTANHINLLRYQGNSTAPALQQNKARGSKASPTIVNADDGVMSIIGAGFDGAGFIRAAAIEAIVDGTPGTNDMPGRLVFSTTADGASSPTERMRIGSNGTFGYGTTNAATTGHFSFFAGLSGADVYGHNDTITVQSGTTGSARGFQTSIGTAAAAFTLANLYHFTPGQAAIGAGSTITNQAGFYVPSSLTGATNNFGFYSSIASGTGRYNFYAAGTAPNFAAGPVYIGQNYYTNAGLGVNYNSGSATGIGLYNDTTVAATTTTAYSAFSSYLGTAASAFTLGAISHFVANQSTIGAGSTATNQYGFTANATLTGATNNYGFYSNIASGTGRWNFYAGGSADNYFSGNVGIGTTGFTALYGGTNKVYITGAGGVSQSYFANNAVGVRYDFLKSRNATIGSHTIVQSGDDLGGTYWGGSDGAAFVPAASITAAVDGTPGTNDMPGRLVFSTTADGASSPTERMRITSGGNVGIGGAPAASMSLRVVKNITGGTYAYGVVQDSTVQSDVTNTANINLTQPNTQATAFTLSNMRHYAAAQGTVGAGSTVTNQQGFYADSNLTGATNNYGFYGNIAAGTGRYNFYAAGTADNYFAGNVGVGGFAAMGSGLLSIQKSLTGATSGWAVSALSQVLSDVTVSAGMFSTFPTTQAASFTLPVLTHYQAAQGTFGAGSTVTTQNGFVVNSTLTGATNNYGFVSNIASGTGRWNFYAGGTAQNYFAGNTIFPSITSFKSSTILSAFGGRIPSMQYNSTNSLAESFLLGSWYGAGTNYGSEIQFVASKSGAVGTYGGTVASGQALGSLQFYGDDGTSAISAAYIGAAVDGTPGTNDMPGRLVFSLTADGTAAPVERMRIDNQGRLGIGSVPSSTQRVVIGGAQNLGASPIYLLNQQTIQSDATGNPSYFYSYLNSQAGSYTVTGVYHFRADAAVLGAGSAITSQYGFFAGGGLTGATNNFGFRSEIAAGTGRYNFYAGGTAANYFAGNVGIGAISSGLPLEVSSGVDPLGLSRFAASANGPFIFFNKSRSGTIGTQTVVQNGDDLGGMAFQGSDGTQFIRGAAIYAQVDGTPGTNDMPGRLVFQTTADGASSGTERMRIDSAGNVGIGVTANPYVKLAVGGTLPSSSSSTYSVGLFGTSPSATTAQYISYESSPTTQAASFTLSNFTHFRAYQAGFGAGSTVTNQHGFYAFNNLTGATNNYGFRSDIASGTGRYNFYAGGSADNYFAGAVGIGALTLTNFGLRVSKSMAGSTTARGVQVDATVQSDVTSNAIYFATSASTQAAAFTLSELYHYNANQSAFGAGSTVTSQYGYVAGSSLVGATNNYGFASYIPSGANRYNFYAAGTAQNLFSGDVLVFGAGGLGYTTGSGGAVTQITSRTTGVTLNKTNGAITLVSAAGSATVQSFTVTNSTVAATDTIIINQKSGTDLYEIHITAVAAGSFRVSFKTTGGTTTEQPVFNFAVIKAVTA